MDTSFAARVCGCVRTLAKHRGGRESQESTWRHDSREAVARATPGVPNHSRDVKPVDDANDEPRRE